MRFSKLMVLLIAICMITALGIRADDSAASLKTSQVKNLSEKSIVIKAASKAAHIIVPDLVPEKAKKFVGILKGINGIQAVKPDMEAGVMMVTYDSKIDFQKTVMPKLTAVDPKVKLKNIKDTKTLSKDKCGGCPNKAKCAGATKDKTAELKPGEVKTKAQSDKIETKDCLGHK